MSFLTRAKQAIACLLLLGGVAVAGNLAVSTPVLAADDWNQICDTPDLTDAQKEAAGCDMTGDLTQSAVDRIGAIIKVVLGVLGVVAAIVIIVAGITMMTTNGDTNKVAVARKAILFAVIGLFISLLAFAIVSFVLEAF